MALATQQDVQKAKREIERRRPVRTPNALTSRTTRGVSVRPRNTGNGGGGADQLVWL